MVLIPKGNGEFREIMLVEVPRKALLGVINWLIEAAVQFHGVLYELWAGRGMETASLEDKLLHKLEK